MANSPKAPIRLYILDDHALFREGLLRLLGSDPMFEIAGASGSAAAALEQIPNLDVDILILDYDLGSENSVPFVRQLEKLELRPRILLVTAGLPDQDALELIRLGVAGVFHKQNPPEDLHSSIRKMAEGKVLLDQSYLQSLVTAATERASESQPRLTERDLQILRFLVEGLANKEIAAQLRISESAVKASLQQLFAKTGVRTRSQLVRIALEDYRDEL
jgi:two-component system, NarL family, nitrate/nitrite response regulator NarL